MAYKKESSTHCGKCGVEWNSDLSNKFPKRALCRPCQKIEYEERKEREKKNPFKRGQNRFKKYEAFKIENRKHIYKAVNLELRALNDRSEVRKFLTKRFNELLEDKALWDYLNDTDIENKYN